MEEINLETWREIPSLLGKYSASSLGRIKNNTTGRILKNFDNGRGYRYLTFRYLGRRKNFYVHRLVCEAFFENPNNYLEINHIDGKKSNNIASNLEWCNKQMNIDHAKLNGFIKNGESNSMHKLKEIEVIEILNLFLENPTLNKTHVGNKYSVNMTCVLKILKGIRWKQTFNKWLIDNNVNKSDFVKSIKSFKMIGEEKSCSVCGLKNVKIRNGMCQKHYRRSKIHGTPSKKLIQVKGGRRNYKLIESS